MRNSKARSSAAAPAAAVGAFLKRPAVIVAEVAALAAGSALAASIPQGSDEEELRRLIEVWPRAGPLLAALGLHDVVTSPWFLVIVALCLSSLVAVQLDQWPRLARRWRAKLDATTFSRAAYRRELPLVDLAPPEPRFWSSGKVGLAGSPLFHLGLVIVALAGVVRVLTFRDVVVSAGEGDVLPTVPGIFEAERGGALSRPFVLSRPVRVDSVMPEYYPSGALRGLTATVTLGGGDRAREERRTIAINEPLDLGGGRRLYLRNAWGAVAALEHHTAAGTERILLRLEPREHELRGGTRTAVLELRARTAAGARPEAAEVRVLREGVLLGVHSIRPGAELALGPGETLRMVALHNWTQFRGSSDPSRGFFFVGISIAIAGIVLMLGFTRVDAGVFVEREKLVVALRPHRFAPLYAERFDAMCRKWESRA